MRHSLILAPKQARCKCSARVTPTQEPNVTIYYGFQAGFQFSVYLSQERIPLLIIRKEQNNLLVLRAEQEGKTAEQLVRIHKTILLATLYTLVQIR